MQMLNRSIEEAALARRFMDQLFERPAVATPPADRSADIDAHNAAVDRRNWERQRAKQQRRTAAERLSDPL